MSLFTYHIQEKQHFCCCPPKDDILVTPLFKKQPLHGHQPHLNPTATQDAQRAQRAKRKCEKTVNQQRLKSLQGRQVIGTKNLQKFYIRATMFLFLVLPQNMPWKLKLVVSKCTSKKALCRINLPKLWVHFSLNWLPWWQRLKISISFMKQINRWINWS